MMLHPRSPFLAGYLAAMIGFAPLSAPITAFANPQNGNVAAGTATISGQGTSHVIVNQASDRAVINWQTFNIGAGERTQFIQPGASSIALNRVTGGLGPSTILGTIDANGRVFLVNPDGMLFGSTAVINTAGFLATTHDITDTDFMAGRNNFTIPGNPTASIVNLGTITATNAGIAALVAPGVRNSGVITAELGKVALASNNGFTLDFYGDKLITMQVDGVVASQVKDVQTNKTLAEMAEDGATDLALVKNEGSLRANGGRVELTAAAARQVVDAVINNTGVIEANSVGSKNGMIVLGAATASTKGSVTDTQKVKVSGTLSAKGKNAGEKGGKIQITGENIALNNARIDASGKGGGGKVLIGGDVGGGNGNAAVASLSQAALEVDAVPTASTVTVDAATLIDVSATERGNGGKAVIWSDQLTSFAGAISARGGALGGDGGFAEVSSKGRLSYNGFGDLRAPAGKFGTLLLDPTNLYIYGPDDALPEDVNTSAIAAASIASQLALSNVIVATGSSGDGAGNITVAGAIQWNGDTTLTLAAYNDIYFGQNAAISNIGGGSLFAVAGVSYSGTSAWTTTGHGTVKFFGSDSEVRPIDWSQSSGNVYFAYNPEVPVEGQGHKYQNQADFSSNVSMGSGQFGAYMWVNDVVDLQNVSQNLGGQYVFANIDATSTAETGFTPIGNIENPFTGHFVGLDSLTVGGLGGTIDGLQITSSAAHVGLFGVIGYGGFVSNVELTNVKITASGAGQYVGTLAGANYGVINESHAEGLLGNIYSASGTGAFGGLVGFNAGGDGFNIASECSACNVSGILNSYGGVIRNSSASVGVTANGPASGYIDAGGLVGLNSGSIVSSYATGTVDGTYSSGDGTYLGGLVGWNTGGTIFRSFATGAVNGVGSYGHAGGLVGVMSGGEIVQSFALGSVTVDGPSSWAGGLVGTNSGVISESYALGLVSASGQTAGALIGVNDGTVSSSYWNTQTSGQSSAVGSGDGSGMTGLTLAEAVQQESYTDWNFGTEGAWAILNGQTTPFLQSIAFVPTVQPPPTSSPGNDDPNVAPIQPSQYSIPTDPNQTTVDLTQSSDPTPQGGQSGQGGGSGGQGGNGGAGNNPPPPPSGPPPGPGIGRTLSEQKFSGVPPLTETRFLPGEVVVQVSNTISPDRIQEVARQLGITLIASQAIDGSGRVVYRFSTSGGKDIRDVIRALEKQQIVASAQPNYVFGLAEAAPARRVSSTTIPLPRPAPLRTAQAAAPPIAPSVVDAVPAHEPWPVTPVPPAAADATEATGALPTSQELSSDLQSDMASRTTGLPTGDAGQYIIDKLRLGAVHSRALGRNVTVAVIDSEIDTQHPDLAGVVSDRFDATGAAPSPHAHGTGMAGAIASHRRLLGIAPGVRILAVKAFDETNTSAEATSFQILKGLDWAIAKRPRIINMSFAGPRDLMLERAMQKAYDAGIVLIAAAGNAGPKSPPLYPAADVNVIAVSASDYADRPFAMANRGRHIAVAAPGVDVLVPSPKGGYQLTTGTSVAAAHVSGVAALLLESRPGLTPKDVRRILTTTAKAVSVRGGAETFGAGIVDPFQALSTLTARSVDAAPARTVH